MRPIGPGTFGHPGRHAPETDKMWGDVAATTALTHGEPQELRALATWEIPAVSPDHTTSLSAMQGEITAVVGANGS